MTYFYYIISVPAVFLINSFHVFLASESLKLTVLSYINFMYCV